MKDWFLNLQPRERLMVTAGAAAAVVIVVWGGWLQLSRASARLRDSVAEQTALLADLRRAEALDTGSGPSRSIESGGQSLVVLVDSTSKAAGLAAAITRTRPEGADGISVSFQNASFDGLLTWLVGLQAEHGIAVESASFNGARGAGLVSGQLSLRR